MLPKEIVSLVDKILQLKAKDINNDTREFEEGIDKGGLAKATVGVSCMI